MNSVEKLDRNTMARVKASSVSRDEVEALPVSRLKIEDAIIALTLFVTMFIIGRFVAVPGVVGTFHDDGVYVSTAKSLAEGSGYRLINFPGEPWQTKYPIGFPLVLALIWKIFPQFPGNVELMQNFTILCASLFLSLTYLFLVRFRYVPRPVAALATVFCLTVPGFIFFSGQVLSEMPFALSLIVAFWHLESYLEKNSSSAKSGFLLGISLAIPLLVRSIGIVVPVGALICLIGKRRSFMVAGITFATIALLGVVAPATYGSSVSQNQVSDNVRSYQTNYLDWWKRNAVDAETGVILKNLQELPGTTGKMLFGGVFHCGQSAARVDELKLLCVLLGMSAWLVMLKSEYRTRTVSIVLWCYTLVVLLWPWPPFRFIMPILPLMYAFILAPVFKTARRFPIAGALALPFLLICLGTNIASMSQLCRFIEKSGIPVMSIPKEAVSFEQYQATMNWIKENTAKSDCIASTYDSLTYLYTGRKTVRPYELDVAASFYGKTGPAIGNEKELLSRLKRYQVRYLVVTPQPNYAEEGLAYKLMREFKDAYRQHVSTSYSSADGRFQVLKIDLELYLASASEAVNQ